MQDWQAQTRKNGLEIRTTGRCQLCGSDTSHGISECFEMSAKVTNMIGHQSGVRELTVFLCVDSHALQHPEAHGRWSNHFHLTRLMLILDEKIQWSYRLSPLLSEILNAYKAGREEEIIQEPGIAERGLLTVSHVGAAASESEYVETVWKWADTVYQAYTSGHEVAGRVAKLFLKRTAR
jgi:Family of unknown function (DUF5946)